jgi:aldose 1-epimerase
MQTLDTSKLRIIVMYAKSSKTGCAMEVYTDARAAIVYTGNWLNNLVRKENKPYNKHDGFCFETCYVDSNENFNPSRVKLVGPGKPFYSRTTFRFSNE